MFRNVNCYNNRNIKKMDFFNYLFLILINCIWEKKQHANPVSNGAPLRWYC